MSLRFGSKIGKLKCFLQLLKMCKYIKFFLRLFLAASLRLHQQWSIFIQFLWNGQSSASVSCHQRFIMPGLIASGTIRPGLITFVNCWLAANQPRLPPAILWWFSGQIVKVYRFKVSLRDTLFPDHQCKRHYSKWPPM